MDFHGDIPAQEYLDDLHSIDVPRLFNPDLSKEQRTNLINLTKKRLNDWQTTLQAHMGTIHKRYEKGQETERDLALAAYKKLDDLGKELTGTIKDLEKIVKKDRTIPPRFAFGTVIFGEYDWGEWHLGEREDMVRFEDMVAIKNRLDRVRREHTPMTKNLKQTQSRIKVLKKEIKRNMDEYKRRKRPLYIGLRVVVLLLFVAVFLGLGYVIYQAGDSPILAGMSGLLAVSLMTVSISTLRRNRRKLKELEQDIHNGRQRLKQLQQRFKKLRIDYYPVNELKQELTADYQSLRATFQ